MRNSNPTPSAEVKTSGSTSLVTYTFGALSAITAAAKFSASGLRIRLLLLGIEGFNMLVHDLMKLAEPHGRICDAFAKAWDVLGRYHHPVVSVSGGADSDIILDIIHRLDEERKAVYVFLNTGLEFQATREHLSYLEAKYNITIQRISPVKPIARTVREDGYPFLSKFISERIHSLQIKGFDFADRTFDEDRQRYPQYFSNLKWWHNIGSYRLFNIARDECLKEFMMAYPPTFSISSRCCNYSKKLPFKHFMKEHNGDLSILGLRKCEGGIRQATTNCLTWNAKNDYAVYRPIFWFTDKDKAAYEQIFGVTHSDCYTVYGMKRTGCAGCPYNSRVFAELERVRQFEPGLVRAAEAVFAPAYDYTRRYREFKTLHSGETLPLFIEEDK